MGTMTQEFCRQSQKVHFEHYVLTEELHALDIALNHLRPDFNDSANLTSAKQIQMFAKQMLDELPTHFQREEREILTTVSTVSPELDFFAREMRRQHEDLLSRLKKFCGAIDDMAKQEGLTETIERGRHEGRAFSRELAQHISLEEQELGGFL